MNNLYWIKNFRVFDENGVTMPIKPITILTGCNSSGKSSIVKSMVLLDTYLKGILEDFNDGKTTNLGIHKLDFSMRENSSLGGFDRVLHKESSKPYIELGYTVHSHLLCDDVKVTYRFGTDDKDVLNNGYLKGVSIEIINGGNIFSFNRTNYNKVRYNFFRYVWGQYINDELKKMGYYEPDSSYCYDWLNEFKDKYGEKAFKDIEERENLLSKLNPRLEHKESFVRKYLDDKIGLLKYAEEFGTLFFKPILKTLFPMNKGDMKKFEDNLVKEKRCNKYVSNVFNDFYTSEFETFGQYYRQREYEFIESKHSSGWPLTSNYRLSDDNKLREACRYNDHTIDFVKVYDAIVYIGSKQETDFLDLCTTRESKIFEMFNSYLSQVFSELHTISMPHNLSYVSSSLVNIKRLYSLESTDSFTNLLKNYFAAERIYSKSMIEGESNSEEIYHPGDFMNKWLQLFGLVDSIKMEVDETQTGVTIRLYESNKDTKGSLLSDQGYGVTQLFVILLRIETAILESQRYCSLDDEGEYSTNPKDFHDNPVFYVPSTIAIEEPEVHQHPKFQSMLADVFVDAYKNYNVNFIIETHSEYLIRKLQNLVAAKKIDRKDTSIIYVYDADLENRPQNEPQLKKIEILPDGRLSDKFGEGFFDEADRLAMNLLTF
jgi:hypothetical protein